MQSEFVTNVGTDAALDLLDPIYNEYSDTISYADLIVLAGGVAVEVAGGPTIPFCPGRVDAENGETFTDLSPRDYYTDPVIALRDTIDVRFCLL